MHLIPMVSQHPAKSGVSTRTLQAIEDDIAAELAGRDALTLLELRMRALHRRGLLDDDDLRIISAEIAKARAAVDRKLTEARAARGSLRD